MRATCMYVAVELYNFPEALVAFALHTLALRFGNQIVTRELIPDNGRQRLLTRPSRRLPPTRARLRNGL